MAAVAGSIAAGSRRIAVHIETAGPTSAAGWNTDQELIGIVTVFAIQARSGQCYIWCNTLGRMPPAIGNWGRKMFAA